MSVRFFQTPSHVGRTKPSVVETLSGKGHKESNWARTGPRVQVAVAKVANHKPAATAKPKRKRK